jgi:RimJ/RimL family protein N-acetyltransferase
MPAPAEDRRLQHLLPNANPRFEPVEDARPNDSAQPAMLWPPSVARLKGNVVELTPCVPDRDAEPLFELLATDAIWQHMPGRPRTAQAYSDILTSRIAAGRFMWVVRLLEAHAGVAAGSIVGTSSYMDVSVQDARLEIGATAYVRNVWASKVNPETKLLLLSYAFDTLSVGRVQLKTDVRNVRSQQAIARLGARYEGTLRRHQRRDDGTVRDSVLFSIIVEEWPSVRAALSARLDAGDERGE